jgi:ferredoxin-NADP reductase
MFVPAVFWDHRRLRTLQATKSLSKTARSRSSCDLMNTATRLKRRTEVAEGTIAFYFERPPDFQFVAGQFVDITLINPPEKDEEGDYRSFTIASSPSEEDVMIATRIRDTAFKRVLKTLSIGSEVKLEGPFGNLVLHQDGTRPAVFLTGGIGVTPFRSISIDSARKRAPHRLWMFYSNRRPEDAAFLDELRSIENENTNFNFVPTMTKLQESRVPWDGERGVIDKKMLEKYLGGLNGPIYYVAGPPGMVAGMRKLLGEAGVKGSDVRSEEFSGY